jgi:hypothetical protein
MPRAKGISTQIVSVSLDRINRIKITLKENNNKTHIIKVQKNQTKTKKIPKPITLKFHHLFEVQGLTSFSFLFCFQHSGKKSSDRQPFTMCGLGCSSSHAIGYRSLSTNLKLKKNPI